MSAAHCLFTATRNDGLSPQPPAALAGLRAAAPLRRRGIAGSSWAQKAGSRPRLPALQRDRQWAPGLRWAGYALDRCSAVLGGVEAPIFLCMRHNRGGVLELGVLELLAQGGAVQRTRLLPVDVRTAEGWVRTLAAERRIILLRDEAPATGRVVNALRDLTLEVLSEQELVEWERRTLSVSRIEIRPDSLRARLAREASGGHGAALLELESLHLADLRSLLIRRAIAQSGGSERGRARG